MKNLSVKILIAIITIIFGLHSFSQDSLLAGDKKERRKDQPTIITSEIMDIDSSKNLAIFTGNVKVDDQELNINCQKMTIYLVDMASDKKVTTADDVKRNKEISKIICEGDVVIIRKLLEGDNKEEQKATAENADYNVKTGEVKLKGNPILMRGDQKVQGDEISFWRDTERLTVKSNSPTDPSRMQINTDALHVNQNAPAGTADKKDATAVQEDKTAAPVPEKNNSDEEKNKKH